MDSSEHDADTHLHVPVDDRHIARAAREIGASEVSDHHERIGPIPRR